MAKFTLIITGGGGQLWPDQKTQLLNNAKLHLKEGNMTWIEKKLPIIINNFFA